MDRSVIQDEVAADSHLRASIANALHWDFAIPRNRISVDVSQGWVTLRGTAELAYQKSSAEADARAISGVRGVTNEVRLGPPPSVRA